MQRGEVVLAPGATPARRVFGARALGHVGLALAGVALLALSVRAMAVAAGLPTPPLAPALLAWALVLLVRLDVVQRRLGGGDLAGRPVLQQSAGCAILTVAMLASGVALLVPAACLLVVAVHAQWSGRPSARLGAVLAVVLTAASQAVVASGTVVSLVPPATGAVLAALLLLLTLATSTNLVVIARQRRAADALLDGERARRDAELLHAVDHDPLTGALGRRGLGRRLEELDRGRVGVGTAGVVVDLDGFKPVNDRYGHAVGDAVLVAVVGRLGAALPRDAVLARTGGDEFVALVPGLPSARAAQAVADRLEGCLAAPVAVAGREVLVGASVGVAWAAQPRPAEELLGAADDAMYVTKHARRRVPPRSLETA